MPTRRQKTLAYSRVTKKIILLHFYIESLVHSTFFYRLFKIRLRFPSNIRSSDYLCLTLQTCTNRGAVSSFLAYNRDVNFIFRLPWSKEIFSLTTIFLLYVRILGPIINRLFYWHAQHLSPIRSTAKLTSFCYS